MVAQDCQIDLIFQNKFKVILHFQNKFKSFVELFLMQKQ